MKITSTISLFFSLFNISPLFAYEIVIPTYLDGIHTKNPEQKYIKYNLTGSKENIPIAPKYEPNPKSVKSFMSSLIWTYVNNEKLKFLDLIEPKTKTEMQKIPEAEFQPIWQVMRNSKKHYIDHYFKKDGGFFVSWNAENIPTPRGLYLVNHNGKLRMKNFLAKKDDLDFQNIANYFTYRPIKPELATIEKKFNLKDSQYELKFTLNPDRPWIYIFKKNGDVWEAKVVVKDNLKETLKFSDDDPRDNKVLIKFKEVHFTKNVEHHLLVLNTNFPIKKVPIKFFPKENLLIK